MLEDINHQIGRRLRRRRRHLGLSQSGVAEACGVGFQQIQKYESGAPLLASRLVGLAAVLDVDVDYFFE